MIVTAARELRKRGSYSAMLGPQNRRSEPLSDRHRIGASHPSWATIWATNRAMGSSRDPGRTYDLTATQAEPLSSGVSTVVGSVMSACLRCL